MPIPIYQVDAFAAGPFSGNPAAVCLMDEPKPDSWLQSVAAEMNLSETAFVWRKPDHFHLRWFTPVSEVELCGHATLATSHVLWKLGWLRQDQEAVFETLSGILTSTKSGQQIEMNFPINAPRESPAPDGLMDGLEISNAAYVGTDGTDYLIMVDSESIVRNLTPDYRHLQSVTARGIIVTAASDSAEYDFVSRFFAPALGIDEDPVTGSAHTVLAPYWGGKIGKTEMRAYQASPRGGVVSIRLIDNDRVIIGGRAVTIFDGQLAV